MSDESFLNSPLDWPRYPLMPVIKRDRKFGDPSAVGLVHASNTKRVYVGVNLYSLPKRETLERELGRPPTWGDIIKDWKQFSDYTTHTDLLAAWQLD